MTQIPPLITQAASIARWAPSSHNCQPWQVSLQALPQERSYQALLTLDETARLAALDTLAAEMALSLGLFAGIFCHVLDLGGAQWRCHVEGDRALRITITLPAVETRTGLDAFAEQVRNRRTTRGPFAATPISRADCARLAARHWPLLGTGQPADLRIIQDPQTRQKVAALVAHYGALDFSNFAAWSETYRHIHFQPAPQVAKTRGFPIEALLGPLPTFRRKLLQLLLHPVTMQCLRPFGLARTLARELADLVRTTPAILILQARTPNLSFGDLLETGNRLAELWLAAAQLGLQIHPLSVLLQHARPRDALRLSLRLTEWPCFIARLGAQKPAEIVTPRVETSVILHATSAQRDPCAAPYADHSPLLSD
ncbi:nitroreductase family protein (plasmid) [Thioclava litoralis]|uniref:Nitroreductase family protein n=1 Tax=Thioclava litoralis TaxID=3076557 RepID=A0ABZ1E2S8_9RHOB|nr:nitroreductase family protein [Thioclava sp. FTW29]